MSVDSSVHLSLSAHAISLSQCLCGCVSVFLLCRAAR